MFWPERWLVAEDPSSYKSLLGTTEPFIHNMNAYMPFSFGPANCVGKNLALKEMKMVLCHLIQHVDLECGEGYDPTTWENAMKDSFSLDVGELPVVVVSRGPGMKH